MPTFDRNPLDLADEAARGRPGRPGRARRRRAARRAAAASPAQDPDAPANWPAGADRVAGQPARLVGARATSTSCGTCWAPTRRCAPTETPPELRPKDVRWRDEAPRGQARPAAVSLDFRMTSTTLFSDVVLPAATWYEKHDLSTTDMHPFVHAFNPAIAPPWQTRTDFDAFHGIAEEFCRAGRDAPRRAQGPGRGAADCTTRPTSCANPHGRVRDWKAGECDPVPGVTMPKLVVVERDYGAGRRRRWPRSGRCSTSSAPPTKGVTVDVGPGGRATCAARTARSAAAWPTGARRWPATSTACEAILALSGTTNGRVATDGVRARWSERTGRAAGRPGRRARGQADHASPTPRPAPCR